MPSTPETDLRTEVLPTPGHDAASEGADHIDVPGVRIERLLAEGGMARVYLGRQISLGRRVAVKVLKHQDRELAARFISEGRLVAALEHRHIITIYDVGGCDQGLYIVMEYLEGGSLADRIKQGMAARHALDVVETIAETLSFVHAQAIVHRDIKPANILFHADRTLKLTDFGIAKNLIEDQSITVDYGSTVGTPFYLSPEQVQGPSGRLDGRSDIYSLGVVLHEMLTGALPYSEDTPFATILAHVEQPLPTLPPELGAYQDLLDRMLAKQPDERFASADELVGYIRGFRTAENLFRLSLADAKATRRTVAWPRRIAGGIRDAWRTTALTAKVALAMLLAAGIAAIVIVRSPSPQIAHLAEPVSPGQAAELDAPELGTLEVPLEPAALGQVGEPDTHAVQVPSETAGPPHQSAEVTDVVGAQPALELGSATEPAASEAIEAAAEDGGQAAPVDTESVHEAADAQLAKIEEWLQAAAMAIDDYRLTTPENDSALYYYKQVLDVAPEHPDARAGLVRIADLYEALGRKALSEGALSKSRLYARRGLAIMPNHRGLIALQSQSVSVRRPTRQAASQEEEDVNPYEGTGNFFKDVNNAWRAITGSGK